MRSIKSILAGVSVAFTFACQQEQVAFTPEVSLQGFTLDEIGEKVNEVSDGGLLETNIGEEVHFKFSGHAEKVAIWPGDSVLDSKDFISHNYLSFLETGDVRKYNGFSLSPSQGETDYKYVYDVPGLYQVHIVGSSVGSRGTELQQDTTSIFVRVKDQGNYYNSFFSFSINRLGDNYGVFEAEIEENELIFDLPGGVDLSSVIATFDVAPYSKVFVGETEQISRRTRNNYGRSLEYRIVSPRGEEKLMKVVINQSEIETEAKMLTYSISETGEEAVIDYTTNTISLPLAYMPDEQGKMEYTALFESTPYAVIYDRNDAVTVSGDTKVNYLDFENPVFYRVVSEDGQNEQIFNVVLDLGPGLKSGKVENLMPAPELTFNYMEKTASFSVLNGTDISQLKLTLETVNEGSTIKFTEENGQSRPFVNGETEVDFSAPVAFEVTDDQGRSIVYRISTVVLGA
ncbi:hypothetical protein [Persicobacter diffluens]|uniref:Uncharacterized protein n=1 Tax=Persicobacter diffluens TaxID=981 RepID=A0AAN4W520_9BACT|nr:hypothetical protein PEDI_49790 [Persicobacter diffluens]